MKLEVGQYWHSPESDTEWKVLKESIAGFFTCECTKGSDTWCLGKIAPWHLAEFKAIDYVLGRHPDNRKAQPEQWQPKEGDLVWSKGNKIKMKVHYGFNGHVFYTGEKGYIGGGVFEIEPYINQDAQIDFSVPGQWLRWGRTIFQTNGLEDEGCFYGFYLGDGLKRSLRVSKKVRWQLLTPEQIKPLLDAYKALTESQSD